MVNQTPKLSNDGLRSDCGSLPGFHPHLHNQPPPRIRNLLFVNRRLHDHKRLLRPTNRRHQRTKPPNPKRRRQPKRSPDIRRCLDHNRTVGSIQNQHAQLHIGGDSVNHIHNLHHQREKNRTPRKFAGQRNSGHPLYLRRLNRRTNRNLHPAVRCHRLSIKHRKRNHKRNSGHRRRPNPQHQNNRGDLRRTNSSSNRSNLHSLGSMPQPITMAVGTRYKLVHPPSHHNRHRNDSILNPAPQKLLQKKR